MNIQVDLAGSVVSGNRAISNGRGIFAEDGPGISVTGNAANGNGKDGMVLGASQPAPPLKASGNKAYFNTKLGIDLGAGGIDLGKNAADANGSAHQCENIVCSPAVAGGQVLAQGAVSQPSASHEPGPLATVVYHCGDTVQSSYTLPGNLDCSDTNGLMIGHDGITLNLNGHTISGTPGDELTGVLIQGHSNVVIKNGTIKGFSTGVWWLGPGGGTVQGLRLIDNVGTGIVSGVGAGPLVITGNIVTGSSFGFSVPNCCGTGSLKATITNNVVSGNSNDGIHLQTSAVGSVVSGNRVLSNTNTGIYVNAPGATVTGNVSNGNVVGMYVFSPDPALPPVRASGNRVYWNDQLGIEIGAGEIDAGKNTAGGNGSAHQCENVVCSP